LAARAPEDFDPPGEGGSYHQPVLAAEVAEWMQAAPGKRIIDGTLGGGGHSEGFLEAGAAVVGIDRDPEALAHARQRLARFGDRFQAIEGDFGDVAGMVGGQAADGMLLDLGVSSRQFDEPSRGFSFAKEGPLDMRMGPSVQLTAADVVNGFPEEELVRIFRELGEESAARRIAGAIVRRRAERPFRTTTELAGCVQQATTRRGKHHPATKTFQAIRMTVNDELGSLRRVLGSVANVLRPGARLLVISFHSLEDRMVKRFLRTAAAETIDRPEWPAPRPNPERNFRVLSRRGITPAADEIARNPRSRSARMRVAERLADP
jgi:16S rRNA (cytosine1402-N4)-methyltransferase